MIRKRGKNVRKIVKNLFICCEAVDLCGEFGGFNLHFAFAGGIIAGENL